MTTRFLALAAALALCTPALAQQAQLTPPSAPAGQASPAASASAEDIFWQSIQASDSPAMFEAYLEQVRKGVFPGVYKPLAELKLQALKAPAAAPSAPGRAVTPLQPAAPAAPAPAAQQAALSPASAPIVEACDRAAAHPFDLEKPANIPGVEIKEMAPGAALRACLAAAALPDAPRRVFFELGRAYDKSSNRPDAMLQYIKAADLGHARAMVNVGITFLLGGKGVRRDYQMARSWYDRAAQAGEPDALVLIGNLYTKGQGVRRDYDVAFDYYTRAGNQGAIQSFNALANAYRFGRGVKKDTNRACQIDKDGAAKGSLESAESLRRSCRYLN